MGGRLPRVLLGPVVACCLLSGPVVALDSLPGDADCDGVVSRSDLDHLQAELMDGDAATVTNVERGTVFSCSGADANGDGRVSAADLSALGALILGEARPVVPSGPTLTFLGVCLGRWEADGADPGGVVPIYQRSGGLGFRLVIEAKPGPSSAPVGQNLSGFDPERPEVQPDLQFSSRKISPKGPLRCATKVACHESFPRISAQR